MYDSMKSYALRLNSSVDFPEFRWLRSRQRYGGQVLSGKFLIAFLVFASEIENFVGMMDYIITFYRLNEVDQFAVLKD